MKKKSLLISAMLLGASSAMLMGFDSAATVDDVMDKYIEASQSTTQATAQANLNGQIGLSMTSDTSGTSTLSMGATGDLTVQFTMDPFAVGVTGNLNVDVLGVGQGMELQMYMVPAEGGWDTYSYVNDGTTDTWSYSFSEGDQSDIDELLALFSASQDNFDLSTLPGTWTLGEEAVDVDGTSCYQLLYTVTYDDLEDLILQSMTEADSSASDEDIAMMDAIFSGIVFNVEVDVDADTYLPVRAYMDLNGSDLTGISSLISMAMAESSDDGPVTMPEISLDVSNAYLEILYDYDTPVNITVPDEGLQAKEDASGSETEASSENTVEDTLEELEETLESEM